LTELLLSVGQQLKQLLAAWGTGAALGAVYELFHLIRQLLGGRLVTVLCDLLFSLLCGLSLVLLGFTVGQGHQRPILTVLVLISMGLWRITFGAVFRRLTAPMTGQFRKLQEKWKKFKKKAKNLFHSWANRFIMSNREILSSRMIIKDPSFSHQEAMSHENKTSRYLY